MRISEILFKSMPVLIFILCAKLFASADDHSKETALDPNRFATLTNGLHTIHLPAGRYEIAGTLCLPSDTVLEGEGPATVIRVSRSFDDSRVLTNSDHRRGNSSIKVRSLKLELSMGRRKGETPGVLCFENVRGLVIENVVMDLDTPYYGIDLAAHITSCSIDGCTVVNRRGGGIMLRNRNTTQNRMSCDIVIRNNYVKSTKDEGIAVFGWLGKVENVSITRNVVDARDASFGITVYGIDRIAHTGQIREVCVQGNTVTGGRVGGIAVKGGARRVSIERNTIDGQKNDGIFIHAGGRGLPGVQDVSVKGNVIGNTGRHGILACGDSIMVEGNTIRNSTGCGIYVGGRATVIHNSLVNTKRGILVATALPHTIRDNDITDSRGGTFIGNE